MGKIVISNMSDHPYNFENELSSVFVSCRKLLQVDQLCTVSEFSMTSCCQSKGNIETDL